MRKHGLVINGIMKELRIGQNPEEHQYLPFKTTIVGRMEKNSERKSPEDFHSFDWVRLQGFKENIQYSNRKFSKCPTTEQKTYQNAEKRRTKSQGAESREHLIEVLSRIRNK